MTRHSPGLRVSMAVAPAGLQSSSVLAATKCACGLRFADVLSAPENSTIIAVDIPIGLPDYLGPDSVALSA
jgi:predicted RNase H-like nuclease